MADDLDRAQSRILLCRVLLEAARSVGEADAAQGWVAAKTQAFLEARHTGKVSLADLAAHLGMSPRQTGRQFRRETGTTPMDFLNRHRCERARALLQSGSGVTEAAFAVGFSSSQIFARVFRRYFGLAPGECRRRNR